MAQFQLLRCLIALGGDKDNVVYRHRGNPILYPELPILQFMHGDDAVTDVAVVGTCDMSNEEALLRLQVIYREDYIKEVYPGARPRLPFADGTIPVCTRPIYVPRETKPDNPDPQLRPLDLYTTPDSMPREVAPEWREDEPPTLDELAAHHEDEVEVEDEPSDEEILGVAPVARPVRVTETNQMDPSVSRPNVEDIPQTRVAFRGQARQARDTPSNLPDIKTRTRRPTEHDHDRARG